MKQQIAKSNCGLHLDSPSLIVSRTSLAMQFLFYFFLLLLGVSGTYGCFYTAFYIPISLNVIISCTILFCAVFTIMFLTKLHIILLLVLTSTTAVFSALILRLDLYNLINRVIQGFILTYNSVISASTRKVYHNFFTLPIAPLSVNEIIASNTIFAVFTLFFVIFLMAWILIRRKNTLFCFLLTIPFLGISVVFRIIPNYVAVVILYIFWSFLLFNVSFLQNKNKFNKKKSVFYGYGDTVANLKSLFLIPILISCLMLVNVLFPIHNFQRSNFVKNLRIGLLNLPNVSSSIQIPIQSILGNTNRVNLQTVGNITFTGETVLRVKSSSQEADYLKGFVGSIYTGHSWDSLPEKEYQKLDSILNGLKVQNFSSLFNELLGRPTHTYNLTIQNLKRNSTRVYAPYGLMSKPDELPCIAFINDGFLKSSNSIFDTNKYSLKATTVQIDGWNISESLMKSFLSERSSFINAAQEYKNFVYSHYTQLPEMLKERLDEYRHEHNLYAELYLSPNSFANAIINQVHSENIYTLSPGLAPEDRDFVDYFLFENHKGYCVHFASATVALLRSAGIPARYVEGYAVSTSDFENQDDWADIPDSRSHAWVEIYLSAVGWVPIEATPGAQRGIIDHEATDFKTTAASNNLEEDTTYPKNIPELSPDKSPSDLDTSESSASTTQSSTTSPIIIVILRILPLFVILCTIVTALLSSRKLQIIMRNRLFTQQNNNEAAIAIYNYIVKLYAFVKPNGISECKIPNDLYSLVLKARFSQHMLTERELESLLAYAKEQAIVMKKGTTSFKRCIGKYIYVLF